MESAPTIDTTFDFRSDTPGNKDPDTWSPTLCKYHHLLWSKALPNGGVLELTHDKAPFYHYHNSVLGEYWLSSDAVIPSFRYLPNISELASAEEVRDFETVGYTIGGMMVFPANQIERKWTLNQARGCTGRIRDRFDLTLECIRRYYVGSGGTNPLLAVIERYAGFFRLFQSFSGYVEFFHLQDLVSADCSAVNFFLPFDDFNSPAIPQDKGEYLEHRIRAVEFIEARNQRIRAWSAIHLKANNGM